MAGQLVERQRVRDARTGPRRAGPDEVEPPERVQRRHDDEHGRHERPRAGQRPAHGLSLLAAVNSAGCALGRQTRHVCRPGDVKNRWCTP
jgi:hypothetical protein